MSFTLHGSDRAPLNAPVTAIEGVVEQQLDSFLAAQTARGNQEAFAALYKRHFRNIFDFTARITQEPNVAAGVVQATFVRAWQKIQQGKTPSHIKAWLYTAAANAAIGELGHNNQDETREIHEPSFEGMDSARLSNPQEIVADIELVELVWRSAAALDPREFALLTMHIRHGLSAGEIAECLGVAAGATNIKLAKLKETFAESIVFAWQLQQGQHDCPVLDDLLRGLQTTGLSQSVRKAIREHMRECAHCQESNQRYASPLVIFRALAPVPAAPSLLERVWLQISVQLQQEPSLDIGPQPLGQRVWQAGCYALIGLAVLTIRLAVGAAGIAASRLRPFHDRAGAQCVSQAANRPTTWGIELDDIELLLYHLSYINTKLLEVR